MNTASQNAVTKMVVLALSHSLETHSYSSIMECSNAQYQRKPCDDV
ncbi:hypothetical protein PQBR44_0061 (plasmid) [Pseudomonas putida UWC1]|nr:hypothetical protein PQBR44_0061 [Pseudomonas putida UWC1]